MNNLTKAFLRDAIHKALVAEEDSSALELLSLLNNSHASSITPDPALALAKSQEVTPGPARSYHDWMIFIRQNFIPFMTSNGRLRFTSSELLIWLEKCTDLVMTTGDMVPHANGRATWRHTVSSALSELKRQGSLNAMAFGKEYLICSPVIHSCLPQQVELMRN